MILKSITLTGADDSVDPDALVELSREFPFVEWGILLSKSQEGGPRFPSLPWMEKLCELARKYRMVRLSGHLCGRWVRDLVKDAEYTFMTDRSTISLAFDRMQLNFHGQWHKYHAAFFDRLGVDGRPHIFQLDGVNDSTFSLALSKLKNVVPLYDVSGGRGIKPASWIQPYPGVHNGYAGGLGPDNLEAEIQKLRSIPAENTFWVDMETKVRSEDDTKFDLEKCRACLKIARQAIMPEMAFTREDFERLRKLGSQIPDKPDPRDDDL